jgi:hypothetical protein
MLSFHLISHFPGHVVYQPSKGDISLASAWSRELKVKIAEPELAGRVGGSLREGRQLLVNK